MADSILSSLLSQPQFNVTSDDGSSFSLKVRKTSIKFSAIAHRHMKEDGSSIVDAKTIQPTEISVEIYCQTLQDVEQINDLLQNRTNLFTVSSKGLVFPSMMLDEETVKQSAAVISATPLTIRFIELLVQNVQPIIFAQAADSTLISNGFATLVGAANQTVSSLRSTIATAGADVSRVISAF